jgi:hypothetical protein
MKNKIYYLFPGEGIESKEELAECKEEIKRNNSGGDFFIIGDQFIY